MAAVPGRAVTLPGLAPASLWGLAGSPGSARCPDTRMWMGPGTRRRICSRLRPLQVAPVSFGGQSARSALDQALSGATHEAGAVPSRRCPLLHPGPHLQPSCRLGVSQRRGKARFVLRIPVPTSPHHLPAGPRRPHCWSSAQLLGGPREQQGRFVPGLGRLGPKQRWGGGSLLLKAVQGGAGPAVPPPRWPWGAGRPGAHSGCSSRLVPESLWG